VHLVGFVIIIGNMDLPKLLLCTVMRNISSNMATSRKNILGREGTPPPPPVSINLLTPNDDDSGRTALLTSKCCILYIYSTNIGTEYFKHGIYSPFFFLQNAVCFIILTYLVPVLFTFYIQGVLKLKKN